MEWDPTQFFRADDPPTPFALVVLNQPINEKAFAVLKEHGGFDSFLLHIRMAVFACFIPVLSCLPISNPISSKLNQPS